MFKDSSNLKEKKDISGEVETIIGKSVKMEGDFKSDGSIVIEGIVNGSITTKRDLRVGSEAEITANIEATNAWIAGTVNGNLKIKEALELAPTSKINGDIETSIIEAGRGSQINGLIKMGGAGQQTSLNIEKKNGVEADKE